MDRKTKRGRYSSVDGFINPKNSQPQPNPQRPSSSQTPDSWHTIPTMPVVRSHTSHSSNTTEQPSLLNTTIAGNSESSNLRYSRRKNKKSSKRLTRRRMLALSVLSILLIMIGVGGFLGSRLLGTLDKVFHGNVLSDIGAAFDDTPLNGESSGRVNILLAGDSSDDPGHAGGDLTDSILILSVDTQNHTAFLLSVPRDLWVDIPGVGWQKINAANNNLGTNLPGYPQNGMGQLEHLVVTDLGIPINYYALSDYGAFKDAVDAVGGVSVDIQSPDPRGLYDPNADLKLPNGWVSLNGQQALNLARARGDGPGSYGFPDSDFDRTDHQRQLFTAVTSKAQSLGFLDNPVKISDLFNAFGNNVETDLTLQNVLRLVQITKGINVSAIKSYSYCSTLTLGQDGCSNAIVRGYTDPASGQDALIPTAGIGNYGQMQQYYQQLTSNNPVVKEGASVVILNASDVIGLAKGQENILEQKGFDVAAIADAYNEYPNTMIVDNSAGKDPNSLSLLKQLYPGTTVTSDTGSPEAEEAHGYTATFVVVLGKNWDTTNTTNSP